MITPKAKERTSLLVGYDSGSDEGEEADSEGDAGEGSVSPGRLGHTDADTGRLEAKRRRLVEWTRKRREAQAQDP